MEKLGALLFLAGIVGIVQGGQGVYTVVTNWTPTTMDCADYVREKPSPKWLKLENCYLDVEQTYSSSFLGLYVSDLLVPVRPMGSEDETIHILLSTDGEKFEDFLERLRDSQQTDAPADFTLDDHIELFTQHKVEGLIRFGLELDNDDEDDIEDAVEHLAENWVLIDDGEEPDRGESFGTFFLGIFLIPFSLFLLTRRGPSPT